jgi:hypothetical protein
VPAILIVVIGPENFKGDGVSRKYPRVEVDEEKQTPHSEDLGLLTSVEEPCMMIGICLDLCGLGVRSRSLK